MRSESNVAVLGPSGTFTEIAAKKLYPGAGFVYCDTVNEVFKNVGDDVTEYGVAAIENSLEGSVGKTLNCLMEYDLSVVGEIVLDINLCLMKPTGTEKIDKIISHPHALAQCRRFLTENHPNTVQVSETSTAAAMEKLSDYENAAAVGFKDAAETYGLKVAVENIQDDVSQTRFIAISKKPSYGEKTSIIFSLPDKPGALYDILKVFAEQGINLTKIESRPSRKKLGEYVFYVDFEGGGLDSRGVDELVDSVEKKTTFLKNLGSY